MPSTAHRADGTAIPCTKIVGSKKQRELGREDLEQALGTYMDAVTEKSAAQHEPVRTDLDSAHILAQNRSKARIPDLRDGKTRGRIENSELLAVSGGQTMLDARIIQNTQSKSGGSMIKLAYQQDTCI